MPDLMLVFSSIMVAAMMATSCAPHPVACVEKAGQLKPNGHFYGMNCEHPDHRISRDGDVLYCKCIRPAIPAERSSD